MSKRTWDIGDPEPEGVTSINDSTGEEWTDHPRQWNKTFDGDWKGYKGGKEYMSWDELVRRHGPVEEHSA